jgi:hypothetical protein
MWIYLLAAILVSPIIIAGSMIVRLENEMHAFAVNYNRQRTQEIAQQEIQRTALKRSNRDMK